jgi:small GTP-binding protein
MSNSAKTIVKYFSERFLKIDYYPDSLKSILDLELNQLKSIKEEDITKFKRLNIITLRDLSSVNPSEYQSLSKKALIDEDVFKNALIAAILIANAWNNRKSYMKKIKMKVVIAGLDYAGKTSLINRLINNYNYNDMINLEPTIGANVEEYQSEKLDLILWDLGGQKDHIKEYLGAPERFFVQVDVLIFVVDSQDDIRYDEALKYLKDLIDILQFLNEKPYFVILLNKADSDVINNPDFQIKAEYLADKISNIFMRSEKSWNFEIIPTSIYNFYSSEPEIAKSIKNIFTKDEELDSRKLLPDINQKLQKILDINLKLMDKVVVELTEVKRILHKVVPSDLSQSLFSVPFEKVPVEFISNKEKTEEEQKVKKKKGKSKVTQKDLKRSKASNGPPKRLKSLTKPEEVRGDQKLEKKITKNEIKEKKASLTPANDLNNPPMAPKIQQKSILSLESLKPPPPPPKVSIKESRSFENTRTQVISELKEMFIKRGLATR